VAQPERVLFITGKLAEPALRRTISELTQRMAIEPEVVVMPISVAALLTTDWIRRHLPEIARVDRVIVPGLCRGDLDILRTNINSIVERGPKDVSDLTEYLSGHHVTPTLDRYDIEIIAEINHAPQLNPEDILATAQRYHHDGADVIDIGCDPGSTWTGVGDTVRMLRDHNMRVSVDSFNPEEVAAAVRSGAELVLSVNSTNVAAASDWGCEVVAIPDAPADLASLDRTIDRLETSRVKYRLDPIVEPINFGFAAALGRYLEVRKRYPDAAMMMGVGNLTEMSEVDSAGVNFLLAGFCHELKIHSVLTTEVAYWCQGCVRELDLARRILLTADELGRVPKKISSDLVQLRDSRRRELGTSGIEDLARAIKDRNYRIFAERGEIHVLNGTMHLHGNDPFVLLQEIQARDPKLSAEHAFYLGHELSKAVTALTLGKNYVQDQALRWGHLTREEKLHHPE